MPDKYCAYLYAAIYLSVLYVIGEPLFEFFSSSGVADIVLFVVTVAGLLIPMLYWLRNEPARSTGVLGAAIGFAIGVLIGKRID